MKKIYSKPDTTIVAVCATTLMQGSPQYQSTMSADTGIYGGDEVFDEVGVGYSNGSVD